MQRRKPLLLLCFTLLVVATPLSAQNAAAPSPTFAPAGSQEKGIRVLSLNLRGVRDGSALLKSLRAEGLDGADLMLFQEVRRFKTSKPGAVEELAQALGLQVFFARSFQYRNGDGEGLAILSRFPLLERAVIPLPRVNLRWKSRTRIALAALVQAPEGAIRVYNVHLDSRMGIKERLRQLQPVTETADKATVPVLIGGDFNTNPYGWLQHTLPVPGPNQPARLAEHMQKLGFESAFPRRRPTSHWLRMQLDWIFVKRLHAEEAGIHRVNFSDHHALHARLRFPPAPSNE